MNVVIVRSGETINDAVQSINNTCGATLTSPRPDYEGLIRITDILSVSGPTIVNGRYAFVVVCEAKNIELEWLKNAAVEAKIITPSWAMDNENGHEQD